MPAVMIRLNKFLAQSGLGSRRSVEKFIKSGEVIVNGTAVKTPGFLVAPEHDSILFRGNVLDSVDYAACLILNKPKGYITTAKDERGRKTVFRLIHLPVRVFPVGRLDRDSEGLLLFTNDGELANRLIHPRFKIHKKYLVLLNRNVDKTVVRHFRTGVLIDKKYKVTAHLNFPQAGNARLCSVTISEGKNRQIRKMFAVLGYRVVALQRVALGPLQLGKLPPGEWRYLTDKEIFALKKAAGLIDGN
jgi:pseudouridine synthase